ncbi:MAG: hypothetical protein HZA78_09925 [Candidatus Schekmanbacteria bacterium]|nr:hypothetical protein [Candidatus Schekmanbacteria bacterium]
MPRTITIEAVEKEIEQLTPGEQLKLIEKLAHRLSKAGSVIKKKLDWKQLYGLGKGLWNEDAQEYVNRLREERT